MKNIPLYLMYTVTWIWDVIFGKGYYCWNSTKLICIIICYNIREYTSGICWHSYNIVGCWGGLRRLGRKKTRWRTTTMLLYPTCPIRTRRDDNKCVGMEWKFERIHIHLCYKIEWSRRRYKCFNRMNGETRMQEIISYHTLCLLELFILNISICTFIVSHLLILNNFDCVHCLLWVFPFS